MRKFSRICWGISILILKEEKCEGRPKSKFLYFFSQHFVNRLMWNCREIKFLSFWQHCKNSVAITSQKHTKHSIGNRAAVVCSHPCEAVWLFIFLPPKINQLLKFIGKCVRCAHRPYSKLATGHKVADLWWPNIELPKRWLIRKMSHLKYMKKAEESCKESVLSECKFWFSLFMR